MQKELNKYFENKKRGTTFCERIIGGDVKKFSNFWDKCKDSLMALSAAMLLDYTVNTEPSKEELIAYKKGMADIAMFIGRCNMEIENEAKNELLKKI